MVNLRTDYKDDVLNTSVNTRRKFNMVNNSDGTVSFEDATIYTQVGDSFGAFDINETNHQIEELKKSVSDGKTIVANAITEKGVKTAADATFATMAANILSISTGDMTQLAEAFQYSGLGITEDSTWDEVCDKLAEVYPACTDILEDLIVNGITYNGTENEFIPTLTSEGIIHGDASESSGYNTINVFSNNTYNFTDYEKLKIVIGDMSLPGELTIGYADKQHGSITSLYKLNKGLTSVDIEMDISNITGEKYIVFSSYLGRGYYYDLDRICFK